MKLSIVMITGTNEGVLADTLRSVRDLFDELLISDNGCTKKSSEIIKSYKGKVFSSNNKNLGQQKQWLIGKSTGDWVLVLDSDECVSTLLKEEIIKISKNEIKGYKIPYQNYVFGKPVYWGGERYSKIRLFRNGYGRVSEVPLHEEVIVDGKIGELKGKINHYSYRTPLQLFGKFTTYAWVAATIKRKERQTVNLKKLFIYGLHMFQARFIQDKGYRDGWRGFVLAFAFMYMEALTYWFLLVQYVLP